MSAYAGKPGSFSGAAVGKVTCTGATVKVTFSPPATAGAGGNSVGIKGKLSSCSVSGAPNGVTEKITQGKITGTGSGPGTGCTGLISGSTTPINLTIVWKGMYNGGKAKFTNSTGTVNGTSLVTDGSGNSGFEVPNPSTEPAGGTVTGSFAGTASDESFLYTSQSSTAIANQCGGPHGLKKLNLTHGTVTIP